MRTELSACRELGEGSEFSQSPARIYNWLRQNLKVSYLFMEPNHEADYVVLGQFNRLKINKLMYID